MECPKCKADNSDTQKFCGECGTKLDRSCPACQSLNPSQFKFCGECGHNLRPPSKPKSKNLSINDKLDKIQRYLPKNLTEKILSQKDKIEGERKQVTVMFCDMEGFTPIVEKLGPEEAYSVMDQVYEILIHKVHDYEGTVNEMTGDGIMALFGAPIALEDAPQRAIRSAYAIHREIARFSDKIRQEKPGLPSLKMRVGIHTGPVVVGTLGNNLRVEFKAVGDTVNLASRMEGLAEPGTTYVSNDIFKLTEGFFRFEALGEREVKGKEKPVNVFRVIALISPKTRFDVSAERGLTPFVGKERELELLLDGFGRSKSGRGQAFFIMAEAGVGKSRLLYEFRKTIANEDVTFLEGKCLSYIRGIAYHAIIEVLRSNFDVLEEDGESEITKKVKRGLKILGVDEESTLPYLLALLSVKESGIDKISMSPEEMKIRIIEAVKRISSRGSEIRPLIVVVEDLHWMDKNSEECLKALSDSISGSRIFLIFTYRPEYVRSWGAKSYHSQINLNRLSNRESHAIVAHLLGTEHIDKELDELTLEKTEGVPFFIEEFIKSLKDLKIIEKMNNTYQIAKETQVLNIPSTIQDVIMARVDLLPEDSKKLLQIGSVIEREFRYELLKRVVGLPKDELLSNLSALKDSELLYERGTYPQSNYVFKHALTREVVYDSILAIRRKQLHKEIGNAIEKLYRNNLNEHCEVLAEHYFLSENYSKAADYSRMAGKKAEKNVSLNEAILYSEKRVNSLEHLQRTEDIQKDIIDARTSLGLYLFQLFYFTKAKEVVKSVYEPATNLQYSIRLAQINTIIGAHELWVKEEFSKAFHSLIKAEEISIELDDVLSAFFSNQWLGFAYSYCCKFEKAKRHFLNALKINEATHNVWGTSVVLSCLSHWVFNFCGLIERGYKESEKALRVALRSGDIYSKAIAFSQHGISFYFKGQTDNAIFHLLKGIDLSNKINFIFCNAETHFYLASIYYEISDFDQSERNYLKAIENFQRIQCLPSMVRLCKLNILLTRLCKNQNIPDLHRVLSKAKKNKLKVYEGWTCRTVSEIFAHSNIGNFEEAEDWIKKAIESDSQNGTMWQLGMDFASYADLFRRKGDKSKAKENLARGIDILKECGADGWVEKYEKELATLP